MSVTNGFYPFDWKRAINGDPVVTRDGRKALVRMIRKTLIGKVIDDDGFLIGPFVWLKSGLIFRGRETKVDLFMVCQERGEK